MINIIYKTSNIYFINLNIIFILEFYNLFYELVVLINKYLRYHNKFTNLTFIVLRTDNNNTIFSFVKL